MIAVIGEALIDLIVNADGTVAASPGGAGFNTARTLARLGVPAVFLDPLSGDGFGRILAGRLDADGVTRGLPVPSLAPSTLAVVDVDEAGTAKYEFYLAGTAAADLEYETLAAAFPGAVTALHVGALGLVMEPIASSVERLVTSGLPSDVLLMVDPNCRPGAIGDRDAYLRRLSRILRRADVVKASTEDLAYLSPDTPPRDAAAGLLRQGPALVLVTDGPGPARACLSDRELTAEVPAVDVVDTIGAGDAFGGAFLAWWTGSGLAWSDLNDPGPVGAALGFAVEVAALTCTRRGAEPPGRAELGRGLRLGAEGEGGGAG